MTTRDEVLVEVSDVGKKFCRSIRHSMFYGVTDIAREVLGAGINTDSLRKHEFWGLDDISFELRRGELLGVIGPNGAGKSSLLKVLSGIFLPDRGYVRTRGRLSALIEVSSGFHPLLTGRENIFIRGAILGMSKRELERDLDEIIAFAGLEDAIDTPVKYYSSGMHARLGFSIALQATPDVLLIDEVLAVGDAGFRHKAYNRLSELRRNTATILVSHSMETITRVCDRVLVIDRGQMVFDGDAYAAAEHYSGLFSQQAHLMNREGHKFHDLITSADINGGRITYGDALDVRVEFTVPQDYDGLMFKLNISTSGGEMAAEYSNLNDGRELSVRKGRNVIELSLPCLNLLPQEYYLSFTLLRDGLDHLLWCKNVAAITVSGQMQGHQPYQLTSRQFECKPV
ncbi:MAG: polysaccharide ABC transporter ATP-binding protein [Candidatus Sedimenticola sp. (ex Thyasira tokunagai)]